MNKVQKIRKEVERLQDLTMDKNKNFYSEAAEGEYNALCNIEHFIDSLQEKPVSENLEEAAEEYIDLPDSCLEYSDGWEEKSDWQYIEKAFIAGAKWQKEQTLERACEWLLKNDSYAKPTEVLVRDFRKAMED